MIVFVDGHNARNVLGVDAGNHEADRGTLVREVRERVRLMRPGATVFFVAAMPALVPGGFEPLAPERLAAHRDEVLRIARRLLGASLRGGKRTTHAPRGVRG